MKIFTQKKIYALSLFFSLFMFTSLSAQDAYLHGSIVDKNTGETLIGANVVLKGTTMGVAADIDGNYVISSITPGTYDVYASYIGYSDKIISVTLKAGEKVKLDFELMYGGAVGLDEIVVTAQAKGQMSAINQQLNSKSITNVVSAEKLQELPDANAAESLGRLPGVSVNRSGGEGAKVVIRGMSPKYNKITMEGVTMASSGDDRSTDISMISPYSLDGIEVFKAITADKDADFVGGMVNFKLREAAPDWKTNLVAQMGYNDLKGTFTDYLINGSISNRFLDDNFGVYLQANIENRNRSENSMNGVYDRNTGAGPDSTGRESFMTESASVSDIFRQKKRNGATLVLDYRLEEGSIKFMNFYSASSTKVDKYTFKALPPVKLQNEGSRAKYDNLSYSNILTYEQRFNKIKIDATASHSYALSETPYSKDATYKQIKSSFIDGRPFKDSIYSPKTILDAANPLDNLSNLNRMNEVSATAYERQLSASVNLSYDFKFNDNVNGLIKFGGKYTHRNRDKDVEVWTSNNGQARANVPIWRDVFGKTGPEYNIKDVPFDMAKTNGFDHRDFLNGDYTMGEVVDLDLMEEMITAMQNDKDGIDDYRNKRSSELNDYRGNEQNLGLYTMAEINLGKYFLLIPGVRFEDNSTEYTGIYGNTPNGFADRDYNVEDTVTYNRNNQFFLPMVHLKITPNDWFSMRFAYTHTLSRPSFNQIAPKLDIWGDIVTYNNHQLEPEYSKNWDVYFSFHSNNLGLLTLGGFTKDLENKIVDMGKRALTDAGDYPGVPDAYEGNFIYTYENSKHNAKIYGLEFDWQSNFYFLPGALKGLVMNINYTHIFSEMTYPTTTFETTGPPWNSVTTATDHEYQAALFDQPSDIVNVGLGYDYKGFSARISMMHRTTVFKQPNYYKALSTYDTDYTRLDFSAQQKLPWSGLELFTNINNLTSAQDRTIIGGFGYDSAISNYGMTVDLGIRWRM